MYVNRDGWTDGDAGCTDPMPLHSLSDRAAILGSKVSMSWSDPSGSWVPSSLSTLLG